MTFSANTFKHLASTGLNQKHFGTEKSYYNYLFWSSNSYVEMHLFTENDG